MLQHIRSDYGRCWCDPEVEHLPGGATCYHHRDLTLTEDPIPRAAALLAEGPPVL
jgi:hypothetical protein